MANSTKFLALAAFVAMAFGAKAQTCTYHTPNSSWTASEYYQIINIDAEKLTTSATGLAAHTAADGEGTSTAFTSGRFFTPIMTTEDGETYTPTAVNWPVNYYMACLAPNYFNSAYTKIVLNGKTASGGVNDPCYYNNNTIITSPIWDKKGYIELSRQGADAVNAPEVSRHGYIVIENLPQVERVQWSFSSTSWKRGVKLDIKHGNGEWQPLRWEANNFNSIVSFAEQGYAFEEIIGKQDDVDSKISLRWRIWEGDVTSLNPVTNETFNVPLAPLSALQVVRIHQIRIFSNVVPAEAPNAVAKQFVNTINYSRSGNTLRFDAETEVEIYSIEGRSVYRAVNNVFDLSSLKKGIYIIKANNKDGVLQSKLAL